MPPRKNNEEEKKQRRRNANPQVPQQSFDVHRRVAVLGQITNPLTRSYYSFIEAMNFRQANINESSRRFREETKIGFSTMGYRVRVLVHRFNNTRAGEGERADRRVVPQKRSDRWFYVNIDIYAGETAASIGGRLMEQLERMDRNSNRAKARGSDAVNAGDDEADNFEIYRVDRMATLGQRRVTKPNDFDDAPEFDFLESEHLTSEDLEEEILTEQDDLDIEDEFLDENDPDDYRASHTYQEVPLEYFSIKPLIMRDFTCIYESLMIVLWHSQNGRAPNVTNNDWRLYVLLHFNEEPIEVYQIFWDQQVWRGIQHFTDRHGIRVGLFDAHNFEREYYKVCLVYEAYPELLPRYYLVYYSEHVFPCLHENLKTVYEHQHNIILRMYKAASIEKMFAIVPNILHYLHFEMKLAVFGEGSVPQTYEYLYQVLPGVDYRAVLACGNLLTDYSTFILKKYYLAQTKMLQLKRYEEAGMDLLDNVRRYLVREDPAKNQVTAGKCLSIRKKFEEYKGLLYYSPSELDHYRQINSYYEEVSAQLVCPKQRRYLREKLAEQNRLLKFIMKREKRFDEEIGLAIIDMEDYVDNDIENSSTLFNMVPFCLSLVGQLQQMTVESVYESTGGVRLVYKVRLVKNIRKTFLGFHPRECVSKFIRYLMDNNFCHSKSDFRKLRYTTSSLYTRRLFNNIFAHNGFGFDYLQLYEELHSKMREFKLVGDTTHTKMISGNGLFFYDFALIYRQKLKVLAQKFFPDREDLQKKECNLVIGLQKETVREWFEYCEKKNITAEEHPLLGEVIEYCMRDSEVLYEIVRRFFRTSYTTPFGHGFLQRPFYHSLSSMSYNIFTTCYLRKPIFVNKKSIALELATKRGGITGANSNFFGIGLFYDENSFYPSVMKNEMPVEYVIPLEHDPYEPFNPPVRVTRANCRELIYPYNIYRATYKHGPQVYLPVIATKTHDTLVLVKYSCKYDSQQKHETALANMLFGIELLVAIEETEETEVMLFGYIRFVPGDFIFREFVEDQYNERQKAKRRGDAVGDMFHKDTMNGAQGKFGYKNYDSCKMGGISFVNEYLKYLHMAGQLVGDPQIKQILTNQVDLFELRWTNKNDEYMAPGNTVRIPSYIMALARSHLMRIYNVVARHFGNPDIIAYYDTDSILQRLDLLEPRLNYHIQEIFDVCLVIVYQYKKRTGIDWLYYAILGKVVYTFANYMGRLINDSPAMQEIYRLQIQDCTRIHYRVTVKLIDENLLGACKIEKFVLRGIAIGAKYYGLYYLEYNAKSDSYKLRQAVKIKGVRDSARTMDIFERIDENLKEFHLVYDLELNPACLPVAVSSMMDKWSRIGAGVIVSQQQKYVRPTLTKRRHNVLQGTSEPFLDEDDFYAHKNDYEKRMLEAKEVYKGSLEDLGQYIMTALSKSKLYHATKIQNALRADSKDYFKNCLKTLAESRKRYLLRLQKIKFNCMYDRIFELLLNDERGMQQAALFIPKLEALALYAVALKRTHSRRGIFDMYDEANKTKMPLQVAARSIAYILFLCHYLKTSHPEIEIPRNLEHITQVLAGQVMHKLLLGNSPEVAGRNSTYIDLGRNEKHYAIAKSGIHYWNYCLIYAFEFLYSGVSCYGPSGSNAVNYVLMAPHTGNGNYDELDALQAGLEYELGLPLTTRLTYTSLWRFFNNFYNMLESMRYGSRSEEINVSALQYPLQVQTSEQIDTSLVRGPPQYRALLVNDYVDSNKKSHHIEFDLLTQLAKIDGEPTELGKRNRREDDYDVLDTSVGQHVTKKVFGQLRRRGTMMIQREHIENEALFNAEHLKNEVDRRLAKVLMMHSLVQVNNLRLLADIDNSVGESTGGYILRVMYQLFAEEIIEGEEGADYFSDYFVQQAFGMSVNNYSCKANKDDLIDLIYLYLLLYTGKRYAASMFRVLNDDLQAKHQYTNSHTKYFTRCCQIIFCKPDMFKTFELQKRLSRKTDAILKYLLRLTVFYEAKDFDSDEKFMAELNDLVDDPLKLTQPLRTLLRRVRMVDELYELGEQTFRRALLWREPTPYMILTLRAMLLLDYDIHPDNLQEVDLVISKRLLDIDYELATKFYRYQIADYDPTFKDLYAPHVLMKVEDGPLEAIEYEEEEEKQQGWQRRLDLMEQVRYIEEQDDEWWQDYNYRLADRVYLDEDEPLANSYEAKRLDHSDIVKERKKRHLKHFFELEAEEGDESEEESLL